MGGWGFLGVFHNGAGGTWLRIDGEACVVVDVCARHGSFCGGVDAGWLVDGRRWTLLSLLPTNLAGKLPFASTHRPAARTKAHQPASPIPHFRDAANHFRKLRSMSSNRGALRLIGTGDCLAALLRGRRCLMTVIVLLPFWPCLRFSTVVDTAVAHCSLGYDKEGEMCMQIDARLDAGSGSGSNGWL